MIRNPSVSGSVTSRASELSILNDEECKHILKVVEQDFKLREKEFKRLEQIKKQIQQENEHIKYLIESKDFNEERCIRCFNPFRFLFNPRETCTICKLNVCHDCSIFTKETKTWACKSCLKLKELEALTLNWFYFQSSNKHKRCGSAKVIRELHKREKELAELDEYEDDINYGALPPNGRRDSGSIISYASLDKNVKIELKEYSKRLASFVEKLQEDLGERNLHNNHRTIRGKISTMIRRGGKESLKQHQQQIATEITRARIAISGPLRPVLQILYALQNLLVSTPFVAVVTTFYFLILQRTIRRTKPLKTILDYTGSNVKTNTTHERDLQNLLIQQSEGVLQTNLDQFRKLLTAPNSSINASNFDQKLAQTIFDKCVSREIFQEIPTVIDPSAQPPAKPQRQSPNTSSITSLTKPSTLQPAPGNSSPRTSSASWEIKSRNDNIQKVSIPRNSTVDEEDTEKEDEEREQRINDTNKILPTIITTTESIQFDNGLKLDLSSIDGDITDQNNHPHSTDFDYEAIRRSNARVGEWQTNFTLVESKSSSHSGEETPRSTRDSVFLTIPVSDNKDLNPRIGDKPLEELADDDLYADDPSSSYPIPINTATINEHSQISDNDITNSRKLFPLPANLLLQNHSSSSFKRPSYTYESDSESITSSNSNIIEMKTFIDEDKFRMDPNILDPKFIVRPKDMTVRLGETAKFKVKVSGTEPVDVFWFRFGTDDELINDDKYQLSHDDTFHYLKIYAINKDDEGAYLCVIANDKAQNVDIVKLYVKDNKRSFNQPKILEEFSDIDINEGSPLTLNCKIDKGYPKARVLWYKENTLIQPNEHYKLYYYGDGQHALHVDEVTIEDDNGTFTCLALNAAGRAQITADVFVHEKEVIDIPRNSPLLPNQRGTIIKRKTSEEISTMNDDYDERSPPKISPPLSPSLSTSQNDKDEENNAKRFMDKFKNDRSSKLLENWQNLYEASVNSLENDDDDPKSSIQKPFYLDRQPKIGEPLVEKPRSPLFYAQFDPNSTKPKWEIRLPQLLNSTVGPDRQKRDSTRRHTTSVVLPEQQQPAFTPQNKESNSLSTSEMSNNIDNNGPPSPLVKQLKQKFDRMTENSEHNQSQIGLTKIQRVGNDEVDAAYPLLPDDENNSTDESNDKEVASLTCRGLTSNNGERLGQKTRPMLPIQPSIETIPPKKGQSTSIESFDNNNLLSDNNYHRQKGKTNPPISYPTRSTTSVVKQLIGGGATLVYDSLTPDNISHTTPSLLQHHFYPNHYQKQQKEHVRIKQPNLTNTNKNSLTLTQTQIKSEKPANTKNRNLSGNNDDDNKTNYNKYLKPTRDTLNRSTSMSDNLSISIKSMQVKPKQTSSDSILPNGKNTVRARAELWDRRISTNENETNQPVASYDIEQWSNEFERIQNQN